MRRSLLLMFAPLATAAAQSAAPASAPAKRAFVPNDWYRVTQLAGPQLSPDGSKVAFTVTTTPEAANKRHSEIWLVPISGGEPMRLTSPGTESSNPRWSADGKLLYFSSTRAGGRGTQWALNMDQPSGEAFQPAGLNLPQNQGGATAIRPTDGSFTITTDAGGGNGRGAGGNGRGNGGGGNGRGGGGQGFAFGGDSTGVTLQANANDPFGKMLPLARPPANSITKPENPARFDGMHFTDARFKANGQGFVPSTGRGGAPGAFGGGNGNGGNAGPAAAGAPSQIYLQRTGGERKKLTTTAYSHRNVSVSPDGKWLVFSADAALRSDSVVARDTTTAGAGRGGRGAQTDIRAQAKTTEPVDRNETDLYLLPVAGCEAGSDCKPKKVEFFGTETNLMWTPDSKTLLFVGRAGRNKSTHLMSVTPDGGKAQDVLPGWQFEPANLELMKDGSLVMQATTGGSEGIYRLDVPNRKLVPIVAGRRVISGEQWDKSQEHIVYVSTDVTHPTELFVTDVKTGAERKLTSFNDKLNSEVAWQDAERFTFKSVGGLEIESWLMKPYGYEPGKKYPLVFYIHGGPHSAYNEAWFDEFQSVAGGGMWVLYSNPRGSSNYNTEYQLTRGRWGAEDYQDLMKAVDIAAAHDGIDSTRMGVTGGSYGGFMTAWIETKTNRFKAAETDRMISDWTYWWGASDAQTLTDGEFYGAPWQNQAMYDSLSPIRHVANVRTPTLLVQSEEDFRAPIGDAELWYTALKRLGVPAEFVRYPRSNHDLSRTGEPWLITDRLSRIRQWFTYWLITNPQPAPAPIKK